MGRHKKKELPALPSSPVKLADALLYAEKEIRRTVNDERQALSFIGTTPPEGSAGKVKAYKDRTAAAAIKLADGLSCVVLDDGRTIRKPERWLAVFDAVRKRAAAECQRPEMIFDTWRSQYGKESIFVSSEVSPQVWRDIRKWIRYHVLTEARAAGLVTFDEKEVIEDIEAVKDWLIRE